MIPMTAKQTRWVQLKWERIRACQQTADKSTDLWNEINAQIDGLMTSQSIFDIVQRDKIKSESLALKGALEKGKWHSGEAQRHMLDLQLFLKMKEMGLL